MQQQLVHRCWPMLLAQLPSHPPARLPACPPSGCVQLTQLSALVSLSMHGRLRHLDPAGCSTLGRLTSLRRLELAAYRDMPPELCDSLAALQQLEHLHLEALGRSAHIYGPWYYVGEHGPHEQQEAEAEAMAAAAAVAQLTALTELALNSVGPLLPPPAALAQLSCLQRLQAWHECERAAVGQQGSAPALPYGLWQRSMRRLSLDWSLLRRSGAAFLQGLPQLEELYIHEGNVSARYLELRSPSMGDLGEAASSWLWEWAEGHAPLQQLMLEALPSQHAGLGPWLARLAERRPGLLVECCSPIRADLALSDEEGEDLWYSSDSDSEEGEEFLSSSSDDESEDDAGEGGGAGD